jgi:septal ring factor EnvC (AmiA/AmiB activator)
MPWHRFTASCRAWAPCAILFLSAAILLLDSRGAAAQALPRPRPETAAPTPALPAPPGPSERDSSTLRGKDLESVRGEQRKAVETQLRLKREIEAIGDDRRKLTQQLTETAARIRAVESQVADTQERLAPLDAREQALRKSLADRRGVMVEILAALQRIGSHPPPALVVEPQDALQSVRSAIMLGALLPDMRREADRLADDLTELARIRLNIAAANEQLSRDLAGLGEERERLALLIEQRQKQQTETEQALAAERQRAAALARQADSLVDLIARLEQGQDAPSRGGRAGGDKPADRPELAALSDPGRLAPAIAFAAAKGRLPLPVNGLRIKEFGAPDGAGGAQKGLSVAARPGAQVTAPCDGWVVYSGSFRNYGQLLILNAGSGYHVLLAGMDRISVDLGQFVVTGEPVAVMGGSGAGTAAALADGAGQPVLYVEFRKDGTPVDPSPWWATRDGEKVRG